MSGFFEQVYELVRQVPPGRVVSYGTIARLLGRPRAARTVGWALNSLPEGHDVPWHRVVNSRGRISLGGHGQGGELQRAMLEAEGVEFDKQGQIDLKRFGWEGPSEPPGSI